MVLLGDTHNYNKKIYGKTVNSKYQSQEFHCTKHKPYFAEETNRHDDDVYSTHYFSSSFSLFLFKMFAI